MMTGKNVPKKQGATTGSVPLAGGAGDGSALSPRHEKLLNRYFDGGGSWLDSYRAQRLLSRSAEARDFFDSLSTLSRSIRGLSRSGFDAGTSSEEAPGPELSLWDRISTRIDDEERAAALIGARDLHLNRDNRGARGPLQQMLSGAFSMIDEMGSRLIWGAGGAVAASALAIALVTTGVIGPERSNSFGGAGGRFDSAALSGAFPTSQSLDGVTNRVPVSVASQVALREGGRGVRRAPVELDWVRSEGRLKVLHDPVEESAIIWVRPRVAKFGTFANAAVARSSSSSLPVALQVRDR